MRQRGQSFQIFKWSFLRNGGPYGYDVWRVVRHLPETFKNYYFAFFLTI